MACVFLLPVAFSPAAHGRSKRLRLPGSTSCIIHCGCRPGNVVLLPSVPMLLRPASLRPTVCLDVTSLVVYSDGYNSGNIVQLVVYLYPAENAAGPVWNRPRDVNRTAMTSHIGFPRHGPGRWPSP